jgi:bis(5'-nucleosyl)-tetraphosphatase (symmetrical)
MIHLIGDVQGCADPLERLLQVIDFSPSRDRIVLLGDLVNRGPGSLTVLRRLAALGEAAVCLLGNHDLHLLALAQGTRSPKKGDTLAEVLQAPDSQECLGWLRQQRLAHVEENWLCVHAGVVPQWDTAQTLALAAEVQAVLRGPEMATFLPEMYGDEPRRWDDTLQGPARWRFIVNTLTRIRFCGADGSLELKTKEAAASALPGFGPWFQAPDRRTAGQPIAFGHWSTLGLVNEPGLLALDTGCVWGGSLTAVRVDGGRREVMQVPCSEERAPGP